MTLAKLRLVLRVLRANVPTALPVVVKRRHIPAQRVNGKKTIECGYTYHRPRCYFILINSTLSAVAQEETLIHEYAHAVAHPDQSATSKMSHDRIWGAAYAKVWTAYEPKPLEELDL